MSTGRREFLGTGLRLATAAGLGLLAPAARAGAIVSSGLVSGVTLLASSGFNVVAVKGPKGSLLIDGGFARDSKAVLKAAAAATGNRQVDTLINTHWHPAQTGSNETVGKAGGVIIAHEVTRQYLGRPVASVDYEGLYGPLSAAGRPTESTRTGGTLDFAGLRVDYGYLPAAHTNGDLYIHIPRADVLVTGGPVASESWPLLDYRNGAWLGGLVRAHEKLAALVGPETRVVPASGRVMTGAELRQQQQMFAAFHERMVVFQNKGYDSRDCVAARPLQEFESRYGDAAPFVTGAFHSLNLAYSPD